MLSNDTTHSSLFSSVVILLLFILSHSFLPTHRLTNYINERFMFLVFNPIKRMYNILITALKNLYIKHKVSVDKFICYIKLDKLSLYSNLYYGYVKSYIRHHLFTLLYGPKIEKNKITVSYYFNGIFYKIPIKLNRGPKDEIKFFIEEGKSKVDESKVESVIKLIENDVSKEENTDLILKDIFAIQNDLSLQQDDTKLIDVTDHITIFLGPNKDFHSQKLTPLDLGYERLRIERTNDDNLIYKLVISSNEHLLIR